MPFQAKMEKGMVAIPQEFIKGMNLKDNDYLTLDIVPLMGQKGFKQLETELGYAQEYEVSMNTLHHYVPMWMRNFKANLPHFVQGAKGYTDIPPTDAGSRRCVVVANGPSLYDTDLSPLTNFAGTIVSTNKPLVHLLRQDVIPDWVTVLDAEEVVMDSFGDDIIETFAHAYKGVMLPTTVHPKVADYWVGLVGKDRVFWSNPRFSDAIAPNICETLASITTIPTCEHGGNVGTYSYMMAVKPLYCNPIGLLGFDMSIQPDSKMSLEQASLFRWFYIPRLDQHYAMGPAFEYYLHRLIGLWEQSQALITRTCNLTPVGPLNAVVGILAMTLDEFCDDEGD